MNRAPRRFGWLVLGAFALVASWLALREDLTPPRDDGIAWRTDFDAALRDARASGRPVLVDFTASWCPPCKVMKRRTWPAAGVREAIEAARLVPVRLDVDTPVGTDVGQRYSVIELPTIVILASDGSVHDVGSAMDAREMIAFVGRAPRG